MQPCKSDKKTCAHYVDCQTSGRVCVHVEDYANGNVSRQERIAPPERLEYLPQGDYNDAIHELMRDKEARDIERLEAIRAIRGGARRLIMAGVLVGITQTEMAALLGKNQATISRIYRIKRADQIRGK